jgi:hypothetical protein
LLAGSAATDGDVRLVVGKGQRTQSARALDFDLERHSQRNIAMPTTATSMQTPIPANMTSEGVIAAVRFM